MADGSYRYQLPTGQAYYYPHAAQQPHLARHVPRNGSPVSRGAGAAAGFSNDTPSPSQSPVPQSPAHNPYGIYAQNHQLAHSTMVNGGPSGPRYTMQVNLTQKFPSHQGPHQQPQQVQHHQHQQQDHPGHSAPTPGSLGHQHSYSSGTLSSATPHFTPNHLQNGKTANGHAGRANGVNEHWAQQLQLVAESRGAGQPNHYAKTLAGHNKGLISAATSAAQSAPPQPEEAAERNRAVHEEVRRQDWMDMDFGGQGLRTISDALFDYTFLVRLYVGHNRLAQLPAQIGRLKKLQHLDASNNRLNDLPPEIGMLVNLKSLHLFDNNLHTLPYEMGSLYQLEMLGIEGNPLDEELKAEMMHNGTKALITHLREQAPSSAPPSQRDWIDLDDSAASASMELEKFSVLTYNILCEKYATHSQFGYTPALALSWNYRKELILQEVREHDADIVCLQEVDMDSFNEYFRPQLAYNNYKGVFWPKSRARTMAEKEAKMVDGCATFYKGTKYILLDKQSIDFSNIAINRPDMKGEHDIFNRVMPRDNIAIITFFENRLSGSRCIVVNAHIFWDPAYKDVKLVQTAILMEQLSKIADKYSKWPPCTEKVAFRHSEASESKIEEPQDLAPSMEYATGASIPLVICGDFNSTAGSGVYDLLAQGTLPNTHSDLSGRKYGHFTRDGMAHPFSLRSSYANIGELSFTNYTPGFTGVIDYIWYSTNALQVIGLLGEVDKDYLKRVPGFPNYHFPSDHLALFARFSLKGRKEKKVLHEPDFGPQRDRRN
ncbi:MAG: Glucose-repressible alcohol dehydrogenase transcriptional effector [Trizodia sp. TS-e1964]|nr:MAG: Glucose-repressible alcohol dehydrogenase transcriptional effector [Trizodia sp. TS-e1964]